MNADPWTGWTLEDAIKRLEDADDAARTLRARVSELERTVGEQVRRYVEQVRRAEEAEARIEDAERERDEARREETRMIAEVERLREALRDIADRIPEDRPHIAWAREHGCSCVVCVARAALGEGTS